MKSLALQWGANIFDRRKFSNSLNWKFFVLGRWITETFRLFICEKSNSLSLLRSYSRTGDDFSGERSRDLLWKSFNPMPPRHKYTSPLIPSFFKDRLHLDLMSLKSFKVSLLLLNFLVECELKVVSFNAFTIKLSLDLGGI